MRMTKDATQLRRDFICRTIHNYSEMGWDKKSIYLVLSEVLRISRGSIYDIHREHCRKSFRQ